AATIPPSADTVLNVVRELYAQLHGAAAESTPIDLDSHLDRDLGFDSLSRVELLSRLEHQCGLEFAESAPERIERVRDILTLGAVPAAAAAPPSRPGGLTAQRVPPARPGFENPYLVPSKAATLNEVLEWHVGRHPDSPHVILLSDEGPHTLTYSNLWNAASCIATGLQ